MGSKKRSAWRKQKEEFAAQLNESSAERLFSSSSEDEWYDDASSFAIDNAFSRERSHLSEIEREKDAALREKACESKNRYATQAEAREALAWCAERGRRNLRIYRCPYCDGWHLTSKPQR